MHSSFPVSGPASPPSCCLEASSRWDFLADILLAAQAVGLVLRNGGIVDEDGYNSAVADEEKNKAGS